MQFYFGFNLKKTMGREDVYTQKGHK